MELSFIDTTLRDGEQRPGIALGCKEKLKISRLLSKLGIQQIEAGIPAMGGKEKKSIAQIAALDLKSKISAWNRMNLADIKHAVECAVDIIHISVPASDIQIGTKLKKDRHWVLDQMVRCIYYARERGFTVNIGLEDASRADLEFLIKLGNIAILEGAQMVRYADTLGLLHLKRIQQEFPRLVREIKGPLGIHAHNDFGMAVANSLAAAKVGFKYIDCTIGGIGERAGNCDYLKYIKGLAGIYNLKPEIDQETIVEIVEEINGTIRGNKPWRLKGLNNKKKLFI